MLRQQQNCCHIFILLSVIIIFYSHQGHGWILLWTTTRQSPQQELRCKNIERSRIVPFVSLPTALYSSTNNSSNNNNNNDINEAIQYKEKAEQLRKEIEEFERQKELEQNVIIQQQWKQQLAKQERRERYSAIVPILKPDGTVVDERCDFSPKMKNVSSVIVTIEAPLPLGLILGESMDYPSTVVVDDVVHDGNGYNAGIQIGDILRACTACRVEMITPTWQLLAGGIGQPKTVRYMYSIDNRPFEEVLATIASNRLDPSQRNVFLVIERRDENDDINDGTANI